MNLYLWHGYLLDKQRYTVYSIANNIEEARKVAVDKASVYLQDAVTKLVTEERPIIHDQPGSFIMETAPQLI